MMTDDDLTAMEALAAMATAGPWWNGDGTSDSFGHGKYQVLCRDDAGPRCLLSFNYHFPHEADSDFVVASRTFVPAAIAEIRRLRAELSYLRSTGVTDVE